MSFVSALVGFVLADCGAARCSRVLATADGGRTWKPLADPPEPTCDIDLQPCLDEIHFADRRNGYLYGTDVYATHDSGTTWDLIGTSPSDTTVRPSVLTAGQWAVITNLAAPRGSLGAPIVPVSLAPVADDLAAAAPDALQAATPIGPAGNDLLFEQPDGGYAELTPSDALISSGLPPESQDGVSCDLGAGSELAFLATCGTELGGGTQGVRRVYVSDDRGQTWRRVADPPEGCGWENTDLERIGPSKLVIGDTSAACTGVLISTDEGAHWKAVTIEYLGGAPLFDLHFTDLLHAVGRAPIGGLEATTDGGLTWNPLSIPKSA